jgi:hypothetical protein
VVAGEDGVIDITGDYSSPPSFPVKKRPKVEASHKKEGGETSVIKRFFSPLPPPSPRVGPYNSANFRAQEGKEEEKGWLCGTCTFSNFALLKSCEICDSSCV